MQTIQDYYVAPGAVVVGNVRLSAGVNVWYASVIRGDLAGAEARDVHTVLSGY